MLTRRALAATLALLSCHGGAALAQDADAPPASPIVEASPAPSVGPADAAPEDANPPTDAPEPPAAAGAPPTSPRPPTEGPPPIGAPPATGYHVPEGYAVSPPPSSASPEGASATPPSAEEVERARMLALRRSFRLSIGAGLASTVAPADLNGDGELDANLGWAGMLSLGWRYHFARFGSFQVRFLLIAGGYQGDFELDIEAHGGELGILSEATIRFVGGPFYLGIGSSLGFFSQVRIDTQLCVGFVLETGFVVGRNEQVDLGAQLSATSGVIAFGGLLTYAFGVGDATSTSGN